MLPRSLCCLFVFGISISSALLYADSVEDTPEYAPDILEAVADLYGISEDQAIDRLALESTAAIAYKHIRGLSLPSYAGSWFDPSTKRLKVAVASVDDLAALEMFDVEPVLVTKSLDKLTAELNDALSFLSNRRGLDTTIVKSYVDIRLNSAVITVDQSVHLSLRSELDVAGFQVMKESRHPRLTANELIHI